MALVGEINVDCPTCESTINIRLDGWIERDTGALIIRPVYDDHECRPKVRRSWMDWLMDRLVPIAALRRG